MSMPSSLNSPEHWRDCNSYWQLTEDWVGAGESVDIRGFSCLLFRI